MRTPIPRRIRFAVLERDGFACQYCGAKAPSAVLHVDHVVPLALGGETHEDNLVTACDACNMGKGAAPLSDSPEHVLEAAGEAYDRAGVVRSLVQQARQESRVSGRPIDAPSDVLAEIASESQAVSVSLAASRSSQSFIADALGISDAYLSNLKTGKRPIPEKLVRPFCAATGTNLLAQYRSQQLELAEADESVAVNKLAERLWRRA